VAKNECCEWQSEIIDDSLKQMFQADESYANGNVEKAVAYLLSQKNNRIPLIKHKAESACEYKTPAPVKELQKDLGGIADKMATKQPYDEVHAEVMRIDKKYAIPGYEMFCKCAGRR
jgi:hypothetical protein